MNLILKSVLLANSYFHFRQTDAQYILYSLRYCIVMLHCGLVTITNYPREREREREGVNNSGDLLNDVHRSVFSPVNYQSEVLHYTAVSHKLDERGNPYQVSWVNFHQRSMPKMSPI